jgi:BirA family transcriptional regulator, biotin operon repressor / biotin---[acetyl-CoA-carboxylase] ligase
MAADFHPTILRLETIDSTNLEAIRQAKSGAKEGLCIVAREQTAGRGRLDRTWQSPKDAGLYLSLVLRPRIEMNQWPLLSLASALAVSDALLRACSLKPDIKWPNDVCVNDRKLCGILAETIETPSGAAAIIGIGINLKRTALPDDLRQTATSIEEVIGSEPDTEQALSELLNAFGERYDILQSSDGCEHTIREWCASSSYAYERRVRVSLENERFTGITRGLDRDGALRVETDDGQIRIVRAGDVTALRAQAE